MFTSVPLRRLLIASALLLGCTSYIARSTPFPYVSPLLSPEAQAFLKTTTAASIAPSTPKEWDELRTKFNAGLHSLNVKARKEFLSDSILMEIADVPVVLATPTVFSDNAHDRAIIFIHGGAYTLGDPKHYDLVFAPIAHAAGLNVYAIDYGLAPEHPYPQGLNDCVAVYRKLLETFKPDNLVFVGDSAGGGMTLATILKARDEGLPLPKAVALLSPWSDISKTGDTYYTLEGISPILDYDKNIRTSAEAYTGSHDNKNPLISPVYADYTKGFPPTLITTGTRDLFLSNCVRLYRKMKEEGVEVTIDPWESMWHVWQGSGYPEARQSTTEIGEFLRSQLASSD